MAFRSQDANQLMLHRQIIAHENTAKKNFDYFTGGTSAQKFYQGRLKQEVDEKMRTWCKDQNAITQYRFGYKPRAKSSGSSRAPSGLQSDMLSQVKSAAGHKPVLNEQSI